MGLEQQQHKNRPEVYGIVENFLLFLISRPHPLLRLAAAAAAGVWFVVDDSDDALVKKQEVSPAATAASVGPVQDLPVESSTRMKKKRNGEPRWRRQKIGINPSRLSSPWRTVRLGRRRRRRSRRCRNRNEIFLFLFSCFVSSWQRKRERRKKKSFHFAPHPHIEGRRRVELLPGQTVRITFERSSGDGWNEIVCDPFHLAAWSTI